MFEWKDEFSVNLEAIDNQHKRMFQIARKLFMLVSTSENFDYYDEAVEIHKELINYTKDHLSFEESLMLKNNYPGFQEHKKQHEKFAKKLDEVSKMDMENDQRQALLDMLTFVSDWIIEHIEGTDMKYKGKLNLI